MTAFRTLPHLIAGGLIFALSAFPALAGDTPSPPGAKVFFINLHDGDTVHNPVIVKMGIEGMTLVPAGTETPDSGHHHLFIDVPEPAGEALLEAIPMDEHHLHFGKGQNETSITLAPGTHTLQLVLGDWQHIPHMLPVTSQRITITVQ